MKKVLVTGGAGFIGSHVVEELLRNKYKVAVIDNFSSGRPENIAGLPLDLYICDVADPSVINLIQSVKPDFIIHLAAQISVAKSVADPLADERINVKGSLNVIQAAHQAGVERIVFASSAAVYGNPKDLPVTPDHAVNPESPYGLAKLTVEHYLKLFHKFYHLSYSILRFSNVYGPRQDAEGEGGVVSIFADRIRKNTPPMIFGDGEQTRDFIFVRDVASAAVRALGIEQCTCVNVSSGSAISINKLFDLMKEVSGLEMVPFYGPERAGDIRDSVLSNDAARTVLSWKPKTDLYEGLDETLGKLNKKKHALS
jgi:UDP-glucose 4-epimerase